MEEILTTQEKKKVWHEKSGSHFYDKENGNCYVLSTNCPFQTRGILGYYLPIYPLPEEVKIFLLREDNKEKRKKKYI